MLEITFEDDYDTAAFCISFAMRMRIGISGFTKRQGIEKTHSSVSIQAYIEPVLTRFLQNAKKMNTCFRSLKAIITFGPPDSGHL